MKLIGTSVSVIAITLLPVAGGFAQQQSASAIYAYPNSGQSQEQQQRDRFECYQWAVNQTGYDPTTGQTLADAQQEAARRTPRRGDRGADSGIFGIGDGGAFEGTGAVGDAATGAMIGAIGGAIAGDAGKGAGWGAVGGVILGGMSRAANDADERRESRPRRDSAAEQRRIEEERAALADAYRRAYSACLTARDYTVQ